MRHVFFWETLPQRRNRFRKVIRQYGGTPLYLLPISGIADFFFLLWMLNPYWRAH